MVKNVSLEQVEELNQVCSNTYSQTIKKYDTRVCRDVPVPIRDEQIVAPDLTVV